MFSFLTVVNLHDFFEGVKTTSKISKDEILSILIGPKDGVQIVWMIVWILQITGLRADPLHNMAKVATLLPIWPMCQIKCNT